MVLLLQFLKLYVQFNLKRKSMQNILTKACSTGSVGVTKGTVTRTRFEASADHIALIYLLSKSCLSYISK